jgi:hypothetical protein
LEVALEVELLLLLAMVLVLLKKKKKRNPPCRLWMKTGDVGAS